MGNQQQRLMTVVATYVTLWLVLWFSVRIADVLGGARIWFLPAGLRFFVFILFGWLALLVELVTRLYSLVDLVIRKNAPR
jgi:hypothetical protein